MHICNWNKHTKLDILTEKEKPETKNLLISMKCSNFVVLINYATSHGPISVFYTKIIADGGRGGDLCRPWNCG